MAMYVLIKGERVMVPRKTHGAGPEAINQFIEHMGKGKPDVPQRVEDEEDVTDAE